MVVPERPRADSNRRMLTLQASALPLGYAARRRCVRAGNRTRTGDLLHGKQTLYQLSYARVVEHGSLAEGDEGVNGPASTSEYPGVGPRFAP